jgi:predicted metal-dependent phosphoesterase TrpH
MSEILLAGRNARNPKIIARLNELGCKITMEQVEAVARRNAERGRGNRAKGPGWESESNPARADEIGGLGLVIGRPHIAQALVEAECVASIKQAFEVYLDVGKAAYFPKERLMPREAIACIHEAGGLAVVAHPVHLKCENPAHLATVINHLKEAGLDGIEVWHCDQDEKASRLMLELAKRYDLVPTGGSDFHGSPKPDVVLGRGRNNVQVPVEVLERLEEVWRGRRRNG